MTRSKKKIREIAHIRIEAMINGLIMSKTIDELIEDTRKTRDLFKKEDEHWEFYDIQLQYILKKKPEVEKGIFLQ